VGSTKPCNSLQHDAQVKNEEYHFLAKKLRKLDDSLAKVVESDPGEQGEASEQALPKALVSARASLKRAKSLLDAHKVVQGYEWQPEPSPAPKPTLEPASAQHPSTGGSVENAASPAPAPASADEALPAPAPASADEALPAPAPASADEALPAPSPPAVTEPPPKSEKDQEVHDPGTSSSPDPPSEAPRDVDAEATVAPQPQYEPAPNTSQPVMVFMQDKIVGWRGDPRSSNPEAVGRMPVHWKNGCIQEPDYSQEDKYVPPGGWAVGMQPREEETGNREWHGSLFGGKSFHHPTTWCMLYLPARKVLCFLVFSALHHGTHRGNPMNPCISLLARHFAQAEGLQTEIIFCIARGYSLMYAQSWRVPFATIVCIALWASPAVAIAQLPAGFSTLFLRIIFNQNLLDGLPTTSKVMGKHTYIASRMRVFGGRLHTPTMHALSDMKRKAFIPKTQPSMRISVHLFLCMYVSGLSASTTFLRESCEDA
jgi:hypothetical protein